MTSAQIGKGLVHRTISAAAADLLRRRILDGVFPAGFQLRQDALSGELGVSRIPIREALLQLEAEGLVRIVPHRGAVVSELSTQEIEELFELRALIEPALLKRSAPLLTAGDYDELDAVLAEYGAELKADHVGRWGELNARFHGLLYRHAGRPRSLALAGNLLQECDRHGRMQLALTNGVARAEAEHAELVRLCRSGEITAACTFLRKHIQHVGRSLNDFLVARKTS
jgi:DNA-binding GntR family transcriptional regulator